MLVLWIEEDGQSESLRQFDTYPTMGEMQQLEPRHKRETRAVARHAGGSNVLNLEGAKAH
jgi:hypothetical protein